MASAPGFDPKDLTGAVIKAARALLHMRVEDLAQATKLGLATIRRAEATAGPLKLTTANAIRIIQVLEAQGVLFISEDDHGGVGVRLARPS